jgi:hypothetical protein
MTRTGKSKPCLPCQKSKPTPSEILQRKVDTYSTVCFQSMDDFQGYAFRGVFNRLNRGTNGFHKRMKEL